MLYNEDPFTLLQMLNEIFMFIRTNQVMYFLSRASGDISRIIQYC